MSDITPIHSASPEEVAALSAAGNATKLALIRLRDMDKQTRTYNKQQQMAIKAILIEEKLRNQEVADKTLHG